MESSAIRLKSRGLIDGIGIQCHQFNMDTVSVSTMNTILGILAATGLPIYVSELDMTGDDATQLARYQQKFPVLWEHSAVKGVTLWGYIEGQTWKPNTHLIRRNGTERPALQWLRTYLSTHYTTTLMLKLAPEFNRRQHFSFSLALLVGCQTTCINLRKY
jgi:endo-1,4-beta-xylanase